MTHCNTETENWGNVKAAEWGENTTATKEDAHCWTTQSNDNSSFLIKGVNAVV